MKPILLFLSLFSFLSLPAVALANDSATTETKESYSSEHGEKKMHRKGKYGKGKRGDKKWTNPDGSAMTEEQKQEKKQAWREKRQERKRQRGESSTQG